MFAHLAVDLQVSQFSREDASLELNAARVSLLFNLKARSKMGSRIFGLCYMLRNVSGIASGPVLQ